MGTAAVILAGGRASRMGGGDKPLLRLPGGTILDHVIRALAPQVTHLAVSANGDPARFPPGLPVLPDSLSDQPGPLAGVLAGMNWAAALGCTDVLSVPGDCPFLPGDLLLRLRAERGSAAIACAGTGGRTHPVVALWPCALRDDLREALGAGVRKVGDYAVRHGIRVVAWPANPDPFLNVNTPADLVAARRRARRPSAPRLPAAAPTGPPPD